MKTFKTKALITYIYNENFMYIMWEGGGSLVWGLSQSNSLWWDLEVQILYP